VALWLCDSLAEKPAAPVLTHLYPALVRSPGLAGPAQLPRESTAALYPLPPSIHGQSGVGSKGLQVCILYSSGDRFDFGNIVLVLPVQTGAQKSSTVCLKRPALTSRQLI